MASEKDLSTFNGFDVLAQVLTGEDSNNNKIKDNDIPYIDPEDIENNLEDESEGNETEDVETTEGTENIDDEENNEDDKSSKDESGDDSDKVDKSTDEDNAIDDETKELEKASVDLIVERLSDQLGFKLDEEAGDFETMEDVVEYLKEVADEASVPEYSSDDVRKLDEFIKSGGKFEDYYAIEAKRMSLDNLDLENVDNQKQIVTENLKRLGYDDDKIKKVIERYEDADVLEDEATDALELLKKYNSEYEEKLLEQQKNYSKQVEEQQQTLIKNVNNEIKDLDKSVGLQVSEREKRQLADYIFKTDENGLSEFQKNFDVKTLVKAAYFAMKGDKLLLKAKESGRSDAYKKFHQKLKSSKVKKGTSSTPTTSREESFDGIKKISNLLLGE